MKRLVIVVLASILSMTVFAEGYQVNLLSTKQTGMGHVGTGMKLGGVFAYEYGFFAGYICYHGQG